MDFKKREQLELELKGYLDQREKEQREAIEYVKQINLELDPIRAKETDFVALKHEYQKLRELDRELTQFYKLEEARKQSFQDNVHKYREAKAKLQKIVLPPGTSALNYLEMIYSKKTIERIFEPLIADAQKDYFAAEKKQQYGRIRIIRVKTFMHLGLTITLYAFVSFGKLVSKIWTMGG